MTNQQFIDEVGFSKLNEYLIEKKVISNIADMGYIAAREIANDEINRYLESLTEADYNQLRLELL
ncbi:MAG: hypothetical protein DRG78_15340 [Epsilonproteobacteria bacterium]|nr:MAG: hypothetical protein DRG78_15340 [Campylobacterota bacterium]